MDRVTLLFWTMISILLSASGFYGVSAYMQGRSIHKAASGTLANGELVHLMNVIDGDTIQAGKTADETVTIRIIGIKSFDSKIEKDLLTQYAKSSLEAVQHACGKKPLRVLLNTGTPKDSNDRYLATLYVDDEDLALLLIRQGLVLVYTVYPFPAMHSYLQEQALARAEKRGVWSNRAATDRALALIRDWRNQAQ